MNFIFVSIWLFIFFIGFKTLGVSSLMAFVLSVLGAIIVETIRHRSKSKMSSGVQASEVEIALINPKPQSPAQKRNLEPIGNIDAICPHCNQTLDKKPGRKKKCQYCGQFIYVRTRPSDEQRVLVTESQVEQIEEQWAIVNGTHNEYVANKKLFADEKEKLRMRFGQEPRENDVHWSLLNQKLIEYARYQNWGLFRNVKFEMGEILRKEGRSHAALGLYFEVCYLDLNGPRNVAGITDRNLLREYPPWDPKSPAADLAPGVIERAARIINKANLPAAVAEEIYHKRAFDLYTSLHLPLPPPEAWVKIEIALFDES